MTLEMLEIRSPQVWHDTLNLVGRDHLLQSWQWGQFKSNYGWRTLHLAWAEAGGRPRAAAQLLFRTQGPGLTMAYCPRGPLLDWDEQDLARQVLQDLGRVGRAHGAFFLKIDPTLLILDPGTAAPDPTVSMAGRGLLAEFRRSGWRQSREQVQFKNTLVIDLQPSEETLLAAMKQKTRYNIRLAARKGVEIRRGSIDDLDLLYRMFAETSLRDGFAIRSPDYYRQAWGAFIEAGGAVPLIACAGQEPLAAIIVFRYGETAYYLYGMSLELQREKMPTYLLQWEAMRWAKEAGCRTYDMWGAPDRIDDSDPMYGVYKFKDGFGGRLVETVGAFDLPLKPWIYRIYTTGMPFVLSIMRRVGRASTRQSLD